MKLLKKMSMFVVTLSFLFVFSIKANAAETYKVGDKVLFGDFGGHVIEDSSSSSNTVKVFVDGWNKTKEEWDEYWLDYNKKNNYNSDENVYNKFEIGINVIKSKFSNIQSSDMLLNDLKHILTANEYTAKADETGWDDELVRYTNDNVPEWLAAENYNFIGNGHFTVRAYYYPDEAMNVDYSFIPGIMLTGEVKVDDFGYKYVEYFQFVKKDAFIANEGNWSGNWQNSYGWNSHLETEFLSNATYILVNSYLGNACGVRGGLICNNYYYDIITIAKSDLTKVIDKCSDYSDNYKITYETNGGDKIDTATVSVTGNKELTTPKREGYIFDGWYTDSTFKNKVSSITPTQKMKDSCLAGFNDVTVYAKWKKELTSDKVSVLGEEKTLENVSSIAVKLLDKVTANIVGTLKTFTAYDITLKGANGTSVEPSGKVKLSLEIPKDYDKTNIGVYRVDGEKLIAYETTINGEYAEIETDHFSTYIVGEKAEVKEETTKVADETSSKDNIVSKDSTPNDSNIQNPKTGDNMTIFFIVGLLLVVGIAIVLRKLKTVK